ncbi:MAG TPA: TonB family protein [Polyangiaceae bacterium]|nr:TonB family protein [Polyangiaceae bacterium]
MEPKYPEALRASGQSASVGLVLKLDASGNVSSAEVAESAGAEFDAAALDAAHSLRFEPARLGDRAVPAKIPFRFDFRVAPAAAEPAANADTPGLTAAPPAIAPSTATEASSTLQVAVEGDRPPREPTREVISGPEITKLPGTNGDALRSVQNLPGVARPPAFDGQLVIRGSSPRDSQVFVDGSNVPLIYHFGGLSSVVPSEVLERIDFYPGNFGPEYGRASGGVIDVGVRSPKSDAIGGLLQFDTVDGRLLIEGPITPSTRFLLAGRRSWVDAWLGPALEASGAQVSTAPVYYDYQAMIEHDVSPDTTLRLFAFGSDDRLKLLLTSPDASDPSNGGEQLLHTGFWRVQGRMDTRLSPQTRWRTTLAVGNDTEQFASGDINYRTGIYSLDLRSDLRTRVLDWLAVTVGVDVQTRNYDVSWRVPPIDIDTGQTSGPLFGRPPTELKANGNVFRPGAYAQLELTPLPGLTLLPGVRADYTHDIRGYSVDPRLGVRYDVKPGEYRTTLEGGVGIFHKPPEPYESVPPFGDPNVQSERAVHYSLGFEQVLARPVELSVQGFYKQLSHLIESTPSLGDSPSGIAYRNTGSGRTYGAELLLRYEPTGRFFGWVAYTLSRSERKAQAGEPFQLYSADQTHVLTALGSYQLGRGWQLGARFRYVTGSPYTPVLGGVMDYDAGAYAPLDSPAQSSARLPSFQQLDLRVDKTWQFASWKFSAYLDVQNVYNRKNTEDISYNYDYSQSKPLPGLPLLPVLGLRGEL